MNLNNKKISRNVIFNFLDMLFRPHEDINFFYYGRERNYWIKDNAVIAEVEPNWRGEGKTVFWIDSNLWNVFKSAFSLSRAETKDYIHDYLDTFFASEEFEICAHDIKAAQFFYNQYINQNQQ